MFTRYCCPLKTPKYYIHVYVATPSEKVSNHICTVIRDSQLKFQTKILIPYFVCNGFIFTLCLFLGVYVQNNTISINSPFYRLNTCFVIYVLNDCKHGVFFAGGSIKTNADNGLLKSLRFYLYSYVYRSIVRGTSNRRQKLTVYGITAKFTQALFSPPPPNKSLTTHSILLSTSSFCTAYTSNGVPFANSTRLAF